MRFRLALALFILFTAPVWLPAYNAQAEGPAIHTEEPSQALNVLEFGAVPGDRKDDTEAFAMAIDAARGEINTVWVPAGRFIISELDFHDDMRFIMHPDAILRVESFDEGIYNVLHICDCDNVTLSGGTLSGERYRHRGSDGEWGMGIGVFNSSNVTIENMTIRSNWGDGIYLEDRCNGITIRNCEITNNRRNNISIIHADNVLIEYCHIANANGVYPESGILIEPNPGTRKELPENMICHNIKILNCIIEEPGKLFSPCIGAAQGTAGYVTARDVLVSGCFLDGTLENYSAADLVISDTTVTERIVFWSHTRTRVESVNCSDVREY